MIGLSLSSTSGFVGQTVREVADNNPDLNYVPIALQRYGTQYTIIPRGDTLFKMGDQVYFTTDKHGVDKIVALTGRENKEIRDVRSEEHTSELQSRPHLVCRLLLEKKK